MLYWRARRGMLELDLMLESFLDHDYEQANEKTKTAFVELLTFSDQDLLELLMAREKTDDPSIDDVVQKIRYSTRIHS